MASNSEPTPTDFTQLPSKDFGGSQIGRAALAVAIHELKSGAKEIGGYNCGNWVKKYLNELAPEGSSWCAGFVSYCFANAGFPMPFHYTAGARDLLNQLRNKGWCYNPEEKTTPEPGDIIVWRSKKPNSWQGHAGIVHHFHDGKLCTIEGNRTSKVEGFTYSFNTMPKLLGMGRVPNGYLPNCKSD